MNHGSSFSFGPAGGVSGSAGAGGISNGPAASHGGGHGGGDGLESKLQGLAAALRKDRDVAHRAHQLAAEKLRLKQEEAGAARKTLESTEAKLVECLESVQQVRAEVDSLQCEVDVLNAKASFQHGELGTLKDQLARHKSDFEHRRAQRQSRLDQLRSMVQAQRQLRQQQDEKSDAHAGAGLAEPEAKEERRVLRAMKDELEADPALEEHRWCSREWTDLVVQRALDLEGWTRALHDDSGRIARVLRAYHRTFGAVGALAAANGGGIVEAASSLTMATPTDPAKLADPASDGYGSGPEAMVVDPVGPDASSPSTSTSPTATGRTAQKVGVGSDGDGGTAPEAMAVDPPGESAVLAEAAGAPRGGADPAAAAAAVPAGEKEPHAAAADEKGPAGAVPVRAGAPAE